MKTRHSNRPAMSLLSAGMLLTALPYSVPAYAAETSRYAGEAEPSGIPGRLRRCSSSLPSDGTWTKTLS